MTTRKLRKFTDDRAVATVNGYLDRVAAGETTDIEVLLDDPKLTISVGGLDIDIVKLDTRFDAAKHIYPVVEQARPFISNIERDAGFWTWLALAWADQLAPVVDSRRRIGSREKVIFQPDSTFRYYAHFLAGPYLAFAAHIDNPARAAVLLVSRFDTTSEAVVQIGARQDIVSSKGALEAASRLYVGPDNRMKHGASGKDVPGVIRRFATLMSQLALNYDLRALSADQVLDLLPSEFDRFKEPMTLFPKDV